LPAQKVRGALRKAGLQKCLEIVISRPSSLDFLKMTE